MGDSTRDGPGRSPGVVEVEFAVADPSYPLVGLSKELGCRVQLEQFVPRPDGGYLLYDTITGTSPDAVREFFADDDATTVRLLSDHPDGGLFELAVEPGPERYFTYTLGSLNAIPLDIWSDDGVGHVRAEIPAHRSAQEVVEEFRAVHPEAELVARRHTDRLVPLFTQWEFRAALDALLTPRQREVLLAAYTGGYFRSPREKSGAELAAELDISQPTFSIHLREGLRKMLSLWFSPTTGPE